jgi:ferredoxin
VAIRVEVDGDKCVGSGNCVFWAPGTFDLDDDGQSVVLNPEGDTEERIRVAAEGCPAQAITVVVLDDAGPAEPQEVSHADRPDR